MSHICWLVQLLLFHFSHSILSQKSCPSGAVFLFSTGLQGIDLYRKFFQLIIKASQYDMEVNVCQNFTERLAQS